jgi:hypothetical protein
MHYAKKSAPFHTMWRAGIRHFSTTHCTRFAPKNMAPIRKQKSGRWRVQVRRNGQKVSETFLRQADAKTWAAEAELQIERGEAVRSSRIARLTTFGELIDLHVSDMKEVGRAPGRSKDATLLMLKRRLGPLRLDELTRDRLLEFGRQRSQEGAGAVTVSMDFGFIKTVLVHAAAVHGLHVSAEPVDLARAGLRRLGLVGKSRERDRACQVLRIDDLHFHDLRHEGASRLFEAGFRIEHVALVTGHKDWKMLRRYTHVRPEALHQLATGFGSARTA